MLREMGTAIVQSLIIQKGKNFILNHTSDVRSNKGNGGLGAGPAQE